MDSIIILLIEGDELRLEALECVRKLSLPQCYIAAGFVRNLVWDYLHHNPVSTPLNDVDVIYFDPNELNNDKYQEYELTLNEEMPQLNWQVRNQAFMHVRNGDQPYKCSIDAMSYWPEKETAVGIRKLVSGRLECVSVFSFESLFSLQVTYNPKRQRELFECRVKSKRWLELWPYLTIAL
jgi:hypothetical protein